jgi:hypothetical protein
MKSEFRSSWRIGAIVALTLVAIAAIYPQPGVRAQAGKSVARSGPAPAPAPVPCDSSVNLAFGDKVTVPGDVPLFAQNDADCFAWAEFIPLNWRQGQSFGSPNDVNPVLWENYITQEALFPPNGERPSPVHAPPLPTACLSEENVKSRAAGKLRVLRAVSKFGPPGSSSFNFPQAAPANAWLGAQNGTNVWYEVLIDPVEQSFVMQNQFYNAAKQQAWVDNGNGHPFIMPEGTLKPPPSTGQVGALELKAAWMEAVGYDPANPGNWNHYLLAPAVVVGPTDNQCRSITVALVGLHIIQKTQHQPFWTWSTFEHVDNVPGDPDSTPACCNFNNTQCQPRQVAVSQSSCLPPKTSSPVTVSCTPNTPPPYYLGLGCPAPVPIQVTRVVPLTSVARAVNKTAHAAIQKYYPHSVFQYYQLVDVLWFLNPTPTPPAPPTVPQRTPIASSLVHGTGGSPTTMTNTTIETFVQSATNGSGKPLVCTDCHSFAAIAPQSAKSPWASDFSFAVGTATAAKGAATKTSGKKN